MKTKEIIKESKYDELYKMLDTGIDDMEAGREVPLREAMAMVDSLIEERKIAQGNSY